MLHNRMTVKIFMVYLFCSVLSACTSPAAVLPSSVTPPTVEQKTEVIKTSTATPKPSPILTKTARSTYTSFPTRTPTMTAQPDPAATAKAQIQELRESFLIRCEDLYGNQTSLSPDGNWLAVPCGYHVITNLEIINREGKRWILQSKDFIRNYPGNLIPKHWVDEDYLYFMSEIFGDGGDPCFYGKTITGLFRIDLNTGTVTSTLPKLSHPYSSVVFSPGGRRFAYSVDHPVLHDLRTGQETTIEVGDVNVGDLTWSPDGKELAYSTCQTTADFSDVKESSVRIYSLDTDSVRTITAQAGGILEIEPGAENNQIIITDGDNTMIFDWSLGQVITPTP